MKFAITLFALVAVAAAAPFTDSNLDETWESFKNIYAKKYDGPETELLRRVLWEKNLHYINQHNMEADMGVYTFWLGINEYADMTNREFVKMFNGMLPKNVSNSKPTMIFINDDIKNAPATVDWRTKGYVTGVKNQQQCGSCWSFSATGSLEGQTFRKTGKLPSLSEQNLVDCSKSYGNYGCEGGFMSFAFEYIKDNGINSEDDYPYEAKDSKCRFKKQAIAATCTGYVAVKSKSESSLKNAVATVGPISVAIDASNFSFQLYRSGIYKISTCSQISLDHGVLAVGYGTDNGQDYWLVKNSWGESWGMKGYIKMARNYNNMCGIATQASYPTV